MSSLFAAELLLLDQAVPQSGCQTRGDSAARMGVPGGLFLLAFPGRMDCRGGLKFLLSDALLPLLAVSLHVLVHGPPPSVLLGAESFLGFPGACLWQSQGQALYSAVSA